MWRAGVLSSREIRSNYGCAMFDFSNPGSPAILKERSIIINFSVVSTGNIGSVLVHAVLRSTAGMTLYNAHQVLISD